MIYGAVWIPQWDIAVAMHEKNCDLLAAVAVVRNQEVIAVNQPAQLLNVHVGMSRHRASAQSSVTVIAENMSLSNRLSDEICEIVQRHVLHCALVQPGLIVFPCSATVDCSTLAEQLIGDIAGVDFEAHIGFAPGVFAAVAASWQDSATQNIEDVVDHLPIERIIQPYFPREKYQRMREFVELAQLLGYRSLGDIRQIPRQNFIARFGKTGVEILQLLEGSDPCPPYFHAPESETIERVLDTPVSHLDHIAFLGQSLAFDMAEKLRYRNVMADDLLVRITLSDGVEKEQIWSMESIDIKGISQRIRWQLTAWLGQLRDVDTTPDNDGVGITQIVITAYNFRPSGLAQQTLWGDEGEEHRNVQRVIDRVRSLIGDSGVQIGRYLGGRYPRQAYGIQQWGTHTKVAKNCQWSGELPRPWPAVILEKPEEISCVCRCGAPCAVSKEAMIVCSGKCELVDGIAIYFRNRKYSVIKIAGPWLHTEGWWSAEQHYYRAWSQFVCDGIAFLSYRQDGKWWVEGIYE
ncbi:hypothetical protein [Arcanobacterium pinnipediorum]|uniref:Protein ImuB n=1 Tax=Arcanobacterium pinnipediorum TaxID=1503041 RepID=A0ABY5AFB2_9ACTO|nr:hypothetical protein [Arcanobacterium pinnipediorum]USR78681.1 hypothetical protein NG665_04620 [Arcanobacterium pinnipediorum]